MLSTWQARILASIAYGRGDRTHKYKFPSSFFKLSLADLNEAIKIY
ncbi:MAG: hypothetical protein AAFY11_01475 [Cyanobacteria bacterium J06641_5]